MSGEEEIFADDYDFKIGGAVVMRDGSDAALFSTGSLTSEVLKAVALLDKEGVSVKLIHLPTIKPIDEETIFSVASKIKKLFSVEEHSIQGGLGGAVAEVVAQSGTSAILERIGLNDRFACGYGTQSEVRKMNGLDSDGIYKQIIGKLTKK
jgi:transketolase